MLSNQRPGIYSRVEISGYCGGGSGGAALLLQSGGSDTHRVFRAESYHDGGALLAGNSLALTCLRLLFGGGAGAVSVIIAPTAAQALTELSALGGIRAVISGFTQPADLNELRDFAEKSAAEQRECIAFVGIDNPQTAIGAAASLSSGRVVITCPSAAHGEGGEPHPLYPACALAAAVLSAPSPAHNFGGMIFPMLRGVANLPEDTIQALLRAGVSVFEQIGGEAELIRALTTDGGQGADGSLRSLNTVMIADAVMMGIRAALRRKLRGAGRATIEGIRDLVAVELAQAKDAGILASFAPPRCRADKKNPGVCVVEVSFGVAHLLSQIHLTAHIHV